MFHIRCNLVFQSCEIIFRRVKKTILIKIITGCRVNDLGRKRMGKNEIRNGERKMKLFGQKRKNGEVHYRRGIVCFR